jgi:hypothetical protein
MQAMNLKQFALNHIGRAALAFGILVSCLTAVTTLTLTGDLPGIGSAGSTQQVETSAPADHTAAEASRRQLAMEREEYLAWRRLMAAPTDRDAAQRELQMERNEFLEWRRSHALPATR